MSLVSYIVEKHPELKRKLYMAAMERTPEDYAAEKLKHAVMISVALGILSFFFFDKQGKSPFLALVVLVIGFLVLFRVLFKQVDAHISKRAKEIDKDVLFAGRFLLIRVNSGQPLINAIEDATKSYGISNEFFKEIIRDIDLGTPLEQALERATTNCPSDKLKKILFQITSALKIGTDVTNFLENILDEIAEQQLIEIRKYGKKLNSMTMFYMLFAIVMPSLGMTMIVVIISLININFTGGDFVLVIVLLAFLQLMFLTMFKSIRPNLHI